MTENTARLHLSDVSGFGGHARCFELTPPVIKDGLGYKFLTIVVTRASAHIDSEVHAFYANERGMPMEQNMRRRGGSHVPHSDPYASDESLNQCFIDALAHMSYEIEGYGVKPLPEGLDYDPNEVPEY